MNKQLSQNDSFLDSLIPENGWDETNFPCCSMSKTELAQLYFPDIKEQNARRKLNTWANYNKNLMEALKYTGYRPKQLQLTPVQVKLFFMHLGEP